MVAPRSPGMTLIAAFSLLVGVTGIIGSATMISDGMGLTRIGATSGPTLGNSSAPPPSAATMAVRVTAFGIARMVLSAILIVGAIGTLGIRPSGRTASLVYAVGWIVVGGIEPIALRYRFGWPVVASAAYPFLLVAVFNSAGWKGAFGGAGGAQSGAA